MSKSTVSVTESAASQESSLGPDGNVLALLAYVFPPVSGCLVYLLEEENEFARFHAAQSIVFGAAIILATVTLWAVIALLGATLGAIPILGVLFTILIAAFDTLLSIVLWIGVLVAWIVLLVTAHQGEITKLPMLGSVAESKLL